MYKPPEYFMEVKMGNTKAEKLTILPARLIECEDQLIQSTTVPAYNDAIRAIKVCLDVAFKAEELTEFLPTARELKEELKKLEVGEIMKRQFSCDKLYKL